jgi:hypothetical protein
LETKIEVLGMKKKSGMEKFTPDARIEEFLKTPLKKEIPKTPLT